MKTDVAVRNVFHCVVGLAVIAAFACGARAQAEEAVAGPCNPVFGAKVCTSYRTHSGKVTEFSMTVPVAAIEQAPASMSMVWPPKADVVVPFAAEVHEQTGFTFTNIYWNAEGHPPAVYMVPHFDFHFFFVPEEEVQGIDCKDTSKPQIIPAGYALRDVDIPQIGTLVGMCVPEMGMHAVPATDLDGNTHWKGSMLVGYYGGKPKFIEPMITRELLLRKHSFSLPVPKIEPTPHVRYPKRFNAIYHPENETYDFTFSY
ncbi:MAG: hypothetical protein WCF30_05900 [Terracidiphilus sp.]